MATNPTNPTPKRNARKRGGPLSPKRREAAQAAFLAAYAETGIITSAAQTAGVNRTTIYEWQEHDETFALRFKQAEAVSNEVIRAEIHRRAVTGWDEPVYQLAKYAGVVRKYSDTLLIFEAKRRMPEYRDKQQVEISGQLDINTLAAEADARFSAFLAATTAQTVLGRTDPAAEG